ncbi:2Fe-2S iron-sulfur cluster binding domain-containing protein [Streptomyces sp. N2-109]|uniref:2Fe-2S iron-sulfur cluster binding domain-containing protein n=1 Tax=Streptomyces gossypii TaxID=2883101 RepID=A0ABT2JTQ9_9ACTN|nr:2Fe-2S iron-sulfur cluster-binding protein [Streptomyces gossypii]MCT2591276.1 2Fe-2S iron-sulfur cluster binding domain-containing protein [Streptomyces gossypii]
MSNDQHAPHGSHLPDGSRLPDGSQTPQGPQDAHDPFAAPEPYGVPEPHDARDGYGGAAGQLQGHGQVPMAQAQAQGPGPGPGPGQPYATPEGWGGEYDADATAFVQLPSELLGGGPGAPFTGESPLAAPGTGQGGYTPPPMQPGGLGGLGETAGPGAADVQDVHGVAAMPGGLGTPGAPGMPDAGVPGAGVPMTPSATTDPSATGQWTLPFAAPSADPGGFGTTGTTGAPDSLGAPDLPAGETQSAAAAMGQGAAAALAGSHEARVRRPLGAGAGAPGEPHGEPPGPGEAYGMPAAPQGPALEGQLADALARRQVPFTGADPAVQSGGLPPAAASAPAPAPDIGVAWPEPGSGHPETQRPPDSGPLPPGPLPGRVAAPPPNGAGPADGQPVTSGATWGELPPEAAADLHPGAAPSGAVPGGLPDTGPVAYGTAAPPSAPQPMAPPAPAPVPGDSAQEAPAPDRSDVPDGLPPEAAAAAPPDSLGSPHSPHSPPSADLTAPLPDTASPLPPHSWEGASGGARWDSAPGAPAAADDSGEYDMSAPDLTLDPARTRGDSAAEAHTFDPPPDQDRLDPEGVAPDDLGTGPETQPDTQPDTLDEAPEPEVPAVPAAPTVSEHPHCSYVLHVNGADRPVTDAWIGESLLYVLRERLGLAGAKDGCSQGECGACSVQVDGRLVASCLVPAATAAGSDVRTVEGLAANGTPSDVQRALTECGAVQCGFCVPGMAMAVHDLLAGNHAPTELQTRQAICGNLCRCSGYRGVLDAVRTVAQERAARAAAEHGEHADHADHAAAQPAAPSSTGLPGQAAGDGAAAPGQARIPHQASPGAGGAQPAQPPEGGGA